MSLDILAIGVHPDDIELSCSGTLIRHIRQGYKVGLCDLTQGELGTRGNAPLRLKEAESAMHYMKALFRENLGMRDGLFEHTNENVLKIISVIRKHKPRVILANAPSDRHPDHGRASKLVADACFYSGLKKIDEGQEAFRPESVYFYIQDRYLSPDIVVDISDSMAEKMEAILCFKSQFFNEDSDEPDTPISSESFLEVIRAKARTYGREIGVEYGEGFVAERVLGVSDLFSLK